MIKLFLTLYFTFFAGLIFSVIVVGNLLGSITESIETEELTERALSGTFGLLNESLKGLDAEQLNTKLAEYKQQFPPLFDIVEVDVLKPTAKERKRFHQHKIVTRVEKDEEKLKISGDDEEVTVHYYQLPAPFSSQLWQTNSDFDITINQWMNITITGHKMIRAMFYMAEQGFYGRPVAEWKQHLSKLQKRQRFPVRLSEFADEKMSTNDLKKIKQGEVVNITQGKNIVTFAHRIENTGYVLVFEISEVPWLLYHMIYVLLVALALLIALPVFLWVWPLWRNLTQLQTAAEHFGKGEYDTRVPQSKYSRLSHLSQAFNVMAEHTQRSIDSHKELTSAVSHELRTPVARMRFSLEMLDVSDNNDDKKRYIQDINTDIEELDLLLGELLTYARFDSNSGSMTMQSQNIRQWLNDSMARLQPLANNKQLDYKISAIAVDEIALFEPRLMSRVLDNLVQNALRYAKTRVKVTLRKHHPYYVLTVEDDGEGIAEKDREKLFDAFSRIDSSRDRRSGGFGLGLAIAKRIVEGHKGRIMIDDSDLGGARFCVQWESKG